MNRDNRRNRPGTRGAVLAGAVAALSLVSCVLASRAPASVESSEPHYLRGRELVRTGQFQEAAKAFQKAIAEYPGHPESHYYLGLVYSRHIMDYGKAEAQFLAVPEVAMKASGRPRSDLVFRAGLGLGKLYVKSGRNEKAIQVIRTILASAPSNTPLDEAFNTLGLAYYYERLYEDAIFELRRAIKVNPANTSARFNLKTIRTRLEHFSAAKAYSRSGNRAQAIAEYRVAIDLDPRFVEARHRLGAELLAAGQPADAHKELRRAEFVSQAYRKTHEIWFTDGLVQLALGRPDDALKSFSRAVGRNPRYAAAYNEIGKILLEKGDASAAVNIFIEAMRIEPKTEYVKNLQAAMARQAADAAASAGK